MPPPPVPASEPAAPGPPVCECEGVRDTVYMYTHIYGICKVMPLVGYA